MENNDKEFLAIPAGRQQQILEYISKNGSAQIKELAVLFNVSEATIRRDLDEMDASGHIKRTHGGALNGQHSTSYERMHSEKMKIMLNAKRNIAIQAASLVNDGETILLDSGTTAYFVGQNLADFKDLTVITYDLYIANSLVLHPTSTLAVTGGIRRSGYNVLVGGDTEDYIRRTSVDKVFLGADAIDISFGVSNANLMEVSIKRLMLKAGKKVILVADHTKLGRTALAKVCDLDEPDLMVIDRDIPEDMLEQLKAVGTDLLLA